MYLRLTYKFSEGKSFLINWSHVRETLYIKSLGLKKNEKKDYESTRVSYNLYKDSVF